MRLFLMLIRPRSELTFQSGHRYTITTISRANLVKVNTVHTVQPATIVERPAGTIETGTPTAFDPIVGAAAARQQYGVDGTGMTVAVIDTGVDYNNPALGGGFGPNAKVIAGYNFASNTPDPMATSSQHGTAVAGLIGSDNPNDLGVAPGVKIVALRVTDSSNTAGLTSIANALQWVINNHTQYNISVVNMSLSDGGNYAQNWFAHDGGVGEQITNLIGQLQSLNIPVVSATGNNFTGQQGEGFTAIVSGVISVTATNTSDQLLSDAQRLGPVNGLGTMTDLAAPGEGMVAPTGDSGSSSVQGTSFATPLVTGAVVLLQQIYQARFGTLPTVAQVTQWLEKGSDPIYDPVTGLTIGRLDIPKAAALIPAAKTTQAAVSAPAPVTVSIPNLQTTTVEHERRRHRSWFLTFRPAADPPRAHPRRHRPRSLQAQRRQRARRRLRHRPSPPPHRPLPAPLRRRPGDTGSNELRTCTECSGFRERPAGQLAQTEPSRACFRPCRRTTSLRWSRP